MNDSENLNKRQELLLYLDDICSTLSEYPPHISYAIKHLDLHAFLSFLDMNFLDKPDGISSQIGTLFRDSEEACSFSMLSSLLFSSARRFKNQKSEEYLKDSTWYDIVNAARDTKKLLLSTA